MILRSLASFMAFVFLVGPIVGVSVWIHVRKSIVKHEVRRHILSGTDKDGFVLLEFSKLETGSLLRWEHSREFEYDGQMYDIVETWTTGDRVYYRCWWDRAETRLNELLREFAIRSFGDTPKFGDNEGFGRALSGTPAFVVAHIWKLPAPRPPCGRLAGFIERWPSRSIRPPTPPPWLT